MSAKLCLPFSFAFLCFDMFVYKFSFDSLRISEVYPHFLGEVTWPWRGLIMSLCPQQKEAEELRCGHVIFLMCFTCKVCFS